MAKSKRKFPTGKFFLKHPKDYTNDVSYPIYLQYTWNRNVLKKTTEIRCRVCDWNEKGFGNKGELKSSYKGDYRRDNNYLQTMLTSMDAQMSLYAQQHPNTMTTDVVRDILDGKPLTRQDRGIDFIEYAKKIVEDEYSLKRIGFSTRKNSISHLHLFSEFLVSTKKNTCERSIYIGDVKKSLIDDFIAWKRTVKNNSDETINKTLETLIKVVKRAADDGYIDRSLSNQIADNKITIKPALENDEDVCDRYLLDHQMKQLRNFYSSCTMKRRVEYLEMFFFAYFACGLRLIDIMTLRWSDVDLKKNELKKILIKTSKRHTIPLIQPAIEILNKWKNRHKVYVFGLLEDNFRLSDEEQLYNKRNTITQSINQSLKVVGETLNLDFPLTMHVARHSFAVYALNSNIDMSVVSRLLGHSSTTVTERVYAKFLPQTLADEVGKLHFNSLI